MAKIEQRRRRFATVATRAGEPVLAKSSIDGAHALAERALGGYREAIDDLGISAGEATLRIERPLDSAVPF